ncbi:MAG: glycosyltransferase family 4 protein [Planctomycetota bacterium]|jgi:glycosyltransferase involved in cell wall biosynthesis
MRIVQFTPGAGDDIYCENCLRDAVLVRTLRKLGYDVLMIPLYLPLPVDRDEQVSNAPIFFGGINVYLQQKSAFFRKTPGWIDRLFDRPKLLSWIGRSSKMVKAQVLGQTTISMLQGQEGRQVKELERLVSWLDAKENKPDIVCLSNALLAGMAGRLRQTIGVPVVCFLQDEDKFLDKLAPPYAQQAWEVLCERTRNIDAFIAVSNYYADIMSKRLELEANKLHIVYPGIATEEYTPAVTKPKIPTIGYLSQMCSDKGLDILVEAFAVIKKNENLKNARLCIAGEQGSEDRAFIKHIRQQLSNWGLINDVEIVSNLRHKEKMEFLQKLSVLSVPEKGQSAYALYILEALATGVPVVEPGTDIFNELLRQTGGGLLYKPNKAGKLAETIEKLLLDADYAEKLSNEGRMAVVEKFNIEKTAEETARIFIEAVKNFGEKNYA